MGTFSVACRVSNIVDRAKSIDIAEMLVDTGSEYSWVPGKLLEQIGVVREKKDLRFIMANGEQITRSVGFAILHVEDTFTVDEVVFAEPGDLLLLGTRTLEGLNPTVDSRPNAPFEELSWKTAYHSNSMVLRASLAAVILLANISITEFGNSGWCSAAESKIANNQSVGFDAKLAIESLVSKNKAPELRGFEDERKPTFGEHFDWKDQDRVDMAILVLAAHAEEAWPELVSHLSDKRYAITYRELDSAWNFTVGEICETIISDSISQAYYIHLPAGALLTRQAQTKMDYPPPQAYRKLSAWCEERKAKKLSELQIEMCNWAIETIPKLTDASESERRNSIDDIRRQIKYLEVTKKPVTYSGFYRTMPLYPYRAAEHKISPP